MPIDRGERLRCGGTPWQAAQAHPILAPRSVAQQLVPRLPLCRLGPPADLRLRLLVLCLIPGHLEPVVSVVHCQGGAQGEGEVGRRRRRRRRTAGCQTCEGVAWELLGAPGSCLGPYRSISSAAICSDCARFMGQQKNTGSVMEECDQAGEEDSRGQMAFVLRKDTGRHRSRAFFLLQYSLPAVSAHQSNARLSHRGRRGARDAWAGCGTAAARLRQASCPACLLCAATGAAGSSVAPRAQQGSGVPGRDLEKHRLPRCLQRRYGGGRR